MTRNRIIWDSNHPDFPRIKDTLRLVVDELPQSHTIFGVRLLTEARINDESTTKITGFQVITQDNHTGTKGITEFDVYGWGVRDSLLRSV